MLREMERSEVDVDGKRADSSFKKALLGEGCGEEAEAAAEPGAER